MLRGLFNKFVLLSLVTFAATLLLWTWSVVRYDVWYAQPWDAATRRASQYKFELGNGHVVIENYATILGPLAETPTNACAQLHHFTVDRSKFASGDGIWWLLNYGPGKPGVSPWWRLQVQLWPLVALTGILPSVRMWRLVHKQRIGAGCCRNCGYDLRATPTRCPECGVLVDAKCDEGLSSLTNFDRLSNAR